MSRSTLARLLVSGVLTLALATPSFARVATDDDYQIWAENWDSLIPADAYSFVPEEFTYDLMSDPLFNQQLEQASRALSFELAGNQIELAGFMVPLVVDGDQVSQFLLVPEAGQCIHVPPPPLNQTILVELDGETTKLRDLYEPVIVTGTINVGENSFEIADSGYTLIAERIETLEYE